MLFSLGCLYCRIHLPGHTQFCKAGKGGALRRTCLLYTSAFKKAVGETPYNYLLKLRIAKSQLLLENPNYSIKEIALLCGFQKPNTFSSLFRNYTGMTPTEYKQKLLLP